MRALKKVLLATLSVGVVSAALATGVLADDVKPTINSATYNEDAEGNPLGTVSVAVANGVNTEQLTVVIFNDADEDEVIDANEIVYINQDAGDAAIFAGTSAMGLKNNITETAPGDGKVAYGVYTIRVGGDKYDGYAEKTFEVKAATPETKTYYYGDCDGNPGISTQDISTILGEIANITLIEEGPYRKAADCDGNPGISTQDISAILKVISNQVVSLGSFEY